MDYNGAGDRNLDCKGLHSPRVVVHEVGPHGRSEGGHVEGCSLHVGVGHLESPWGTRHREGNQGDEVGLCSDRGTPHHMLRMQGLRGCDHLDNRDDRHNDGHLLCLSHPSGSPSSSHPKSISHHVSYRGTGSTRNDPSMGWVIAPTHHVLRRHLKGARALAGVTAGPCD